MSKRKRFFHQEDIEHLKHRIAACERFGLKPSERDIKIVEEAEKAYA